MRAARRVRRAVVDDPLAADTGGDGVGDWRGNRPCDRQEQRLVLSSGQRRTSARRIQRGRCTKRSIDDVRIRIDWSVPAIDVRIVCGLLDVLVCRVGHDLPQI